VPEDDTPALLISGPFCTSATAQGLPSLDERIVQVNGHDVQIWTGGPDRPTGAPLNRVSERLERRRRHLGTRCSRAREIRTGTPVQPGRQRPIRVGRAASDVRAHRSAAPGAAGRPRRTSALPPRRSFGGRSVHSRVRRDVSGIGRRNRLRRSELLVHSGERFRASRGSRDGVRADECAGPPRRCWRPPERSAAGARTRERFSFLPYPSFS
jgi:hypothetical protein